MKKSRFTEEHIVLALKHAEMSTSTLEVCRKQGISDDTLGRACTLARLSE